MTGCRKQRGSLGMQRHNRKPRIGVTGPDKGSRTLWWFAKLAVRIGGGVAQRITPTNRHSFAPFDGFLIAGGSDINPESYGESAVAKEIQYDLQRDALEQDVIHYAVTHKKPLLGICRGMQMINISLGGSLYQEAKDVLEDFLPSQNLISKIIGRRAVEIDKKSALFEILGGYEQYNVNSIHHQAINTVGEGVSVVAREKNMLIQAIEQSPGNEHPFLVGVQWHPELMLHATSSRRLFKALVKTAAGNTPS